MTCSRSSTTSRSALLVAAALALGCGSKKERAPAPPPPVVAAAVHDAAQPPDAAPATAARVSPDDLPEWAAEAPADPDQAFTLLAANAHPAALAYLLRDPHAPYVALRAESPGLTGRATAASPAAIWAAIVAAHPEATNFPRLTRTKARGRALRVDVHWQDTPLRKAAAFLGEQVLQRRIVVTSTRDLRVDLAVRKVRADDLCDALLEVAGLERHRVGDVEHWVDAGAGPPSPVAVPSPDAGPVDAGSPDAAPPPGDLFSAIDPATARLSATLIGPRRAAAVIASAGRLPTQVIEARGTGEADRIEIIATFATLHRYPKPPLELALRVR